MDKPTELENKIFKNLRCLICQGQSIYDSQSDFAESMKIVVRKNLSNGMSEKDIYQFMKKNYGEWVLYNPEINKGTYCVGYNLCVESSVLLSAYLTYMRDIGFKEFNIRNMSDEELESLFK